MFFKRSRTEKAASQSTIISTHFSSKTCHFTTRLAGSCKTWRQIILSQFGITSSFKILTPKIIQLIEVKWKACEYSSGLRPFRHFIRSSSRCHNLSNNKSFTFNNSSPSMMFVLCLLQSRTNNQRFSP